jgi:hypothetical protein
VRHAIQHDRFRALNPWPPHDGALLQAVNRGEFAINGFPNWDLRTLLFKQKLTAVPPGERIDCLVVPV